MATRKSQNEIVKTYEAARIREQRAGRELTPKAFLDVIAPSKRGRSEASSRRYMNKLRTGERSGTRLIQRAAQDSGKRVNVSFIDRSTGEIVSANVVIPYGRSRLDLFRPSKRKKRETALREAASRFLDTSYAGRKAKSMRHMEYLGARSIEHAGRSEKVA